MSGRDGPLTGVRFLHHQKVPMRDSARLSADVFLPRTDGPFPTILFRTPYESSAGRFNTWGTWWAERGYAAVSQDCRGKYESGEGFYPWLTDGSDTVDTPEWIAWQRWSDGKMGIWGRSYGGAYPRFDRNLNTGEPLATGTRMSSRIRRCCIRVSTPRTSCSRSSRPDHV